MRSDSFAKRRPLHSYHHSYNTHPIYKRLWYRDARIYNVSRIHVFPYERSGIGSGGTQWRDNTSVALLELPTNIPFDERVQPVCLASNDNLLLQPPHGQSSDAWVTGWGQRDTNSFWGSSPPTNDSFPSDREGNMTQMHLHRVKLPFGDVPSFYEGKVGKEKLAYAVSGDK